MLFLLAYIVYIRLVLCYFYLRISILSIYTPAFVLFLLAYWYTWYIYMYAWFCAILTCILVLVYILSISILSIIIYVWFCAIICLLVLGIYTPGFVLFLLAYCYLVYIRLVLCYSYLPIGT